ncbi:MAG TPA: PilZ domain-containing protein [Candidatus Dormibacteraeota bacterium]|nr:PilZ domain-containing protein [Candidatus Dormibacteraeota bacterium]
MNPSPDHRADNRLGEALLVSYWVHDDAPPEITETYDIAPGGIALLTHVHMQLGTRVTMQLELRGDAHPPLLLRGTVRWSQNDPAIARYRTGVEFEELDPDSAALLTRYIDIVKRIRDLGIFT